MNNTCPAKGMLQCFKMNPCINSYCTPLRLINILLELLFKIRVFLWICGLFVWWATLVCGFCNKVAVRAATLALR